MYGNPTKKCTSINHMSTRVSFEFANGNISFNNFLYTYARPKKKLLAANVTTFELVDVFPCSTLQHFVLAQQGRGVHGVGVFVLESLPHQIQRADFCPRGVCRGRPHLFNPTASLAEPIQEVHAVGFSITRENDTRPKFG